MSAEAPIERPAVSPVSLDPGAAGPVAGLLSRAFFEDAMFTYILPDPRRRASDLEWFMARGLDLGLRYGQVDVVTDGATPTAVAIWFPPGRTTPTPVMLLRSGILLTPLKLGVGAFRRFMRLTNLSEAGHHRNVPADHWYLMVLATEPARQGTGAGSALIRHGTTRADGTGVPSYLETNNEANLRFYTRHGFRVVFEGQVPDGGPRVWGLRRDPTAPAGATPASA